MADFHPTIENAFKYDRSQIVAHVTNIQNNPAAFCSDQEYLRPVVLPARDAKGALIPNAPAEDLSSQLLQATKLFIDLATTEVVVHSIDPKRYGQAEAAKFLTHDYEEELIHLTFQGVRLPVITIYDILGWLLSITWARPDAQATDANYYMPLLALYTKWCRTLTVLNKKQKGVPAMTHIAWWKSGTSSDAHMLLGCALGQDYQRSEILVRWRQFYMDNLKFTAANKDQLQTEKGVEGNPGYGKCAETFFWIYAKTKPPLPANVRGLALKPTQEDFSKLTEFSLSIAASALRDPCEESCRHLVPQIVEDWKWEMSFSVKELQESFGITAGPVLDEDDIPVTKIASSSKVKPLATKTKKGGQSSIATNMANKTINDGVTAAANAAANNSPALIGAALGSILPKSKSAKK